MDHVSVVVDDLEAATAFFVELGMEREGDASVEGPWVDLVNGIDDVRVDIRMMKTPDGQGRLELTQFRDPAVGGTKDAPPNTLGLRSVMFAVEDVDDMVDRLRPYGGRLLGEIVEYDGVYRLCYLRGPAGIIVALAQELAT
jgi:catechol 2,3-dioxygenase-like lactoylglutathione lyase family enzyme